VKLSRRQFFGLAGALGLSSCARKKQDSLKTLFPDARKNILVFATINDTHVKDANSTAIVQRAVRQINADKAVDFTVVLGDIATDGKLVEHRLAEACFSRLEKPCFFVPGNHDVLPLGSEAYRPYRQVFGETQWREEDEGWAFIGLDTCNGTSSNVTVPPERLDWLDGMLKKIKKNRPIALFTHHPLNPNTKNYRIANADEVIARFSEHNLKLVTSGHYHGNQVEISDGILFCTTACCSSTRGNFDKTLEKGYRRYRIKNQEISHDFLTVAD
jgi:3',5'-cyclic AMP phosphodiesterase CpdA